MCCTLAKIPLKSQTQTILPFQWDFEPAGHKGESYLLIRSEYINVLSHTSFSHSSWYVLELVLFFMVALAM